MSREIKFRAWLKKRMHVVNELQLYGSTKSSRSSMEAEEFLYDRPPLMQYTGLKDKNGVEIYEGDIVRAGTSTTKDGGTHDMNVPVEYVRGIFEPVAYVTDDVLEVIGNIYENPELLEAS